MQIRNTIISVVLVVIASIAITAHADDAAPATPAATPPAADAATAAPTTAPAAAAEFPPITPITLHVADTPVEVILAQIADQAKVSIKTSPENLLADAKPMSLDVDYKPFLDVLVEVCRSAGVEPQLGGGMVASEPTIMLVPGGSSQAQGGGIRRVVRGGGVLAIGRALVGGVAPVPAPAAGGDSTTRPSWLTGPTVSTGAFVVTATNVTVTRAVNPSANGFNPNGNGNVQVRLALMADPAVKVGGYAYNVPVDDATDDKGHSLSRSDYYNNDDFQRDRQQGWTVWQPNVSLFLPPDVGTSIAKLHAHVQVLVITKSDSLSLDELPMDKAVEKTVGGMRMKVGPMKKQGQSYEVPIALFRDDRPQQVWQTIRQFVYDSGNNRSMRLLDAHDQPIPSQGYSGGGESDGAMTFSFRFNPQVRYANTNTNPPGDPAKLVWEIPVQARVVDVPVEFTDLPIP
jgi:hypothetical protein